MEKKEKTKSTTKEVSLFKNDVVICVLAVGLFAFVGIIWAAFTTTLNVKYVAPVKKTETWNIHLDNLSQAFVSGLARESTHPTIDNENLSINDFEFVFSEPGDSGTYTFDVVNSGDIDARLTNLIDTNFVCTDINGSTSSTDAVNVCKNLTYELRYTFSDTIVEKEDTIKANDKVNVTLIVVYNSNAKENEINKNDVKVSGSSTSLVYEKDESVLETTGN